MMRLRRVKALALSLITFLIFAQTFAPLLSAQTKSDDEIRGYSAAQAKAQADWEAKFRVIPKAENLRDYMKLLSAEPHHVGSLYGKKNAEWILARFKEWGLDAKIEEYQVLFPTPKERLLELTEPTTYKAQLKEPILKEDPDSNDDEQLPTYNAYSADGDVTAELVYVNYGVPADYEELEKRGISVKGKVVIARYGASWRGIKPKVAYEHGAIGCIIYSDPKDDGYYQGAVYPEGPYRPDQGAQRGSVADMPVFPGDPLTPGVGATKDAKRLELKDAPTLMKIPVLPISYGDALPLLKALRGPVAPEQWRGALPITYYIGPGPSKVHLKLKFDWSLKPAYNVIARITGSELPDEWIVQGNHHDAWVNGAADPISGMVTVLEQARAFGELLKQGWRPKRTIIMAAWDAEEPGLLGSTEWVEHHAQELSEKAVIYLNSDSTGKGVLGVGGSHTLERFINEVARSVPAPNGTGTVADAVRQRGGYQAGTKYNPIVRLSALGSGSDYTPFIQHLGIASLNTGFGGDGGGGVYHSIYDTFAWYTRFSDKDFSCGRALAQVNGAIVMRLANAPILPFEFTTLANTVSGYAKELEFLQRQMSIQNPMDLKTLNDAIATLKKSAEDFEAVIEKLSANGGAAFEKRGAQDKELNKLLYTSERKLTTEQGLPRRGWFKHQIYAPGFYTGYGVKTIPGVREAIEQKNLGEAEAQMKIVNETLLKLAAHIDAARKLLEAR